MKKFAHRTDDHASTPRLMSRPKCSFMPYVLLHCERYRINYNYESLRIYFCALLYDNRQVCLHNSDKLGLTIESHGSGNYRFHTSDTWYICSTFHGGYIPMINEQSNNHFKWLFSAIHSTGFLLASTILIKYGRVWSPYRKCGQLVFPCPKTQLNPPTLWTWWEFWQHLFLNLCWNWDYNWE